MCNFIIKFNYKNHIFLQNILVHWEARGSLGENHKYMCTSQHTHGNSSQQVTAPKRTGPVASLLHH
jgi:hypothetical protein